jgi:hypothetical protein
MQATADRVGSIREAGGAPLAVGTPWPRASAGGSDVEALATERLEAEITTLAGHIAAATCRWLLLVGEFDRREAWGSWGCKSCAHWLSWQCAMGLRSAREHVRVARALAGLPAIRQAFAEGRLSYSQARALTRVAQPENEQGLLTLARQATAAQLEKLVRGYVKATVLRDQARDAYERRELVWWQEDDGSFVIQARLPAEDGALVIEALRARADCLREPQRDTAPSAPPAPAESAATGGGGEGSAEHGRPLRPPPRTLLADALVDIARRPGAGDDGERADDFQVVVNVDLESLTADAPGTCSLACGTVLAPETARRLGCDRPVVAVHETEGQAASGGRRTRFASRRLNRLLDRRDRGCRFPGCTHNRHLHTHHIQHWAHGGRTTPENLVRLCSHHHRIVHEGGYTIGGDAAGELIFRRPDGRPLRQHPQLRRGCAGILTRLNRGHGTNPAAAAITPDWNGDNLDLDWAVTLLAHDP